MVHSTRMTALGHATTRSEQPSNGGKGPFETEMLTQPDNLAALADLPGRWIDVMHDRRPPKVITLDIDSSESPVHGDQEGSAWNGHFQSKCLHPLLCSTNSATWSVAASAPAMSTAPMAGTTCCAPY